jgi:hypothetical protein
VAGPDPRQGVYVHACHFCRRRWRTQLGSTDDRSLLRSYTDNNHYCIYCAPPILVLPSTVMLICVKIKIKLHAGRHACTCQRGKPCCSCIGWFTKFHAYADGCGRVVHFQNGVEWIVRFDFRFGSDFSLSCPLASSRAHVARACFFIYLNILYVHICIYINVRNSIISPMMMRERAITGDRRGSSTYV